LGAFERGECGGEGRRSAAVAAVLVQNQMSFLLLDPTVVRQPPQVPFLLYDGGSHDYALLLPLSSLAKSGEGKGEMCLSWRHHHL
jgi:hypothetical protein